MKSNKKKQCEQHSAFDRSAVINMRIFFVPMKKVPATLRELKILHTNRIRRRFTIKTKIVGICWFCNNLNSFACIFAAEFITHTTK